MGFLSIITAITPGDSRPRVASPRREDNSRERSQRAPPFSPPRYEAPPPPSYESISTASTRPKGVVSKSDSHRATARPTGSLVAPNRPSSRPQSSRSPQREKPDSSYTLKDDRRFSQASAEEAHRYPRTSEESRRSSRSESDLSQKMNQDRRRSTTGIRTEASHIPRSSEQDRATTGFATYDQWCTRSG
ncbi:uncharacterized protein EAF01_006792 [Botrytis porri]|uniref:uncharacterized protein n=1 Tax=Botrytis porri TaxID=87229 RepID=UPI001901ACB2|nr:uncharacterized protein EAF01_006792 [Botrytis porri]KAF7903743.1 hypothetical protein EAF01_006792 [Botrytis porri]